MRGDEPLRHEKPTPASPREIPRTVVALVIGVLERARILDGLRGRAVVHFTDRLVDLQSFLSTRPDAVDIVILEAQDVDGRPTLETVRALRAAAPGMAVVAYCRAGNDAGAEIRDVVLAGANELLFRGEGDTGIALRAALESAVRANVSELVTVAMTPLVPARLWPFVNHVIRHPKTAQRVATVAHSLGISRRTLVNQCAVSRMPPPQMMIAWCRLAVVGYLVGATPRTIDSIAMELDFPSDTALRNMLKRYVGLTASEIREKGGLPPVIAAFRKRLGSERRRMTVASE